MCEARLQSCLVSWKPARVLCFTVRCENSPHAKPVGVALQPKKALSSFVYVVKQDFQSVWERQCSAAWLEEGRQERWCFGMLPLGQLLCAILQGGALVLHGGVSDDFHGSSSCSVIAHLQTYCAFLMSLVDSPGLLLF